MIEGNPTEGSAKPRGRYSQRQAWDLPDSSPGAGCRRPPAADFPCSAARGKSAPQKQGLALVAAIRRGESQSLWHGDAVPRCRLSGAHVGAAGQHESGCAKEMLLRNREQPGEQQPLPFFSPALPPSFPSDSVTAVSWFPCWTSVLWPWYVLLMRVTVTGRSESDCCAHRGRGRALSACPTQPVLSGQVTFRL